MKSELNQIAKKEMHADTFLSNTWHVFAPLDMATLPLLPQQLARWPSVLRMQKKTLFPRTITVSEGQLDMAPLIGGTAQGRSAYVFISCRVCKPGLVTFGFGADYFFEAFLDGELIYSTMDTGNGSTPPTCMDHITSRELKAGKYCLAIRFVSGCGGSQLCAYAGFPSMHNIIGDDIEPCSSLFEPIPLDQNPETLAPKKNQKPSRGYWGIPFQGSILRIQNKPISVSIRKTKAPWLIFLHNSQVAPLAENAHGFLQSTSKGRMRLGEPVARYVICYADGTESAQMIRQRVHIGPPGGHYAELGLEAKLCIKPEPMQNHAIRGRALMRVKESHGSFWLYAWQNPFPQKTIRSLRFEPCGGSAQLFAVTAGWTNLNPLRWEARKKALLTLPLSACTDPLNETELRKMIQLDLGQIISIKPEKLYDTRAWNSKDSSRKIKKSKNTLLIEYTAHSEAVFHLKEGKTFPIKSLQPVQTRRDVSRLRVESVPEDQQKVTIFVIDEKTKKPVPVRFHAHGICGEYLAPLDRNRIPNPAWIEDYGADQVAGQHFSTYIPGETTMLLPRGHVYIEIHKGFEIRPLRQAFEITPSTKKIQIPLVRVLPWRERGWVTADTHVHVLSPQTALLEGAGEDVNVVNLLALQLGEHMVNTGDFDGKTTLGSRENGGSGEYLVRVGTENRQHMLGHISLLGYEGKIITPLSADGPTEAGLGDPLAATLTEWAAQCKRQNGLVIMPHFPFPRLESAATIVAGLVDGVEFKDEIFHSKDSPISPYSLSDWYRFLNNGYACAAVGGTDKMSAGTPVGGIRTYAFIGTKPFSYQSWKEAIHQCRTFVTTGPLMDFSVEGQMMGARIKMKANGGTVAVNWTAASVMGRIGNVELVRNGEIIESKALNLQGESGSWNVPIQRSGWLALLIRNDRNAIVAHSSPIMIEVKGTPFYSAMDAVSILEQIEGTMVYIQTLGTRTEAKRFKALMLKLTAIHRSLHNRMHSQGHFHHHTIKDGHAKMKHV